MINILLEGYDIAAPYLYETIKKYIKSTHKVAILAFSFRDSHVLTNENKLTDKLEFLHTSLLQKKGDNNEIIIYDR